MFRRCRHPQVEETDERSEVKSEPITERVAQRAGCAAPSVGAPKFLCDDSASAHLFPHVAPRRRGCQYYDHRSQHRGRHHHHHHHDIAITVLSTLLSVWPLRNRARSQPVSQAATVSAPHRPGREARWMLAFSPLFDVASPRLVVVVVVNILVDVRRR